MHEHHDGGDDEFDQGVAEASWVAGADYVKRWEEARVAVEGLRAELVRLGCPPGYVSVAAGTGVDGIGVVRVQATPAVIFRALRALRRMDESDTVVSPGEVRDGVAVEPCGGPLR